MRPKKHSNKIVSGLIFPLVMNRTQGKAPTATKPPVAYWLLSINMDALNCAK